MRKFPVDAPKERMVEALEILGFQIVREEERGQSWVNIACCEMLDNGSIGCNLTKGL
jgi:hypothetical protein